MTCKKQVLYGIFYFDDLPVHVIHLALKVREICAACENCIICMQMAEAGILLMAEDHSKIRVALANIGVCLKT